MLLGKAEVLYRSLSEDEKSLLETKSAQADLTAEEWLGFLARIDRYEQAADAERSAASVLGGAATVLGVGLFVVGSIAWRRPELGLLLGSLPLAAAGRLFLQQATLRRRNLANHPRAFARGLIEALRPELKPGARLTMHVEFSGGRLREKQVSRKSGPVRVELRRPVLSPFKADLITTKETTYENAWIEGRTRLVDGSSLEWRIVDRIGHREEVTYSQRGVQAFDREDLFLTRSTIDLALKLPPGRTARPPATPYTPLGDKVEVESGSGGTVVRMRREVFLDGLRPLDVGEFAALLAEARRRGGLSHGRDARAARE
ncbi:MAG: hypothetical protein HYZ53_27630 [Planctomycetes bacterium]|nr:hypothetical protein [Planctomycetota bacterium]